MSGLRRAQLDRACAACGVPRARFNLLLDAFGDELELDMVLAVPGTFDALGAFTHVLGAAGRLDALLTSDNDPIRALAALSDASPAEVGVHVDQAGTTSLRLAIGGWWPEAEEDGLLKRLGFPIEQLPPGPITRVEVRATAEPPWLINVTVASQVLVSDHGAPLVRRETLWDVLPDEVLRRIAISGHATGSGVALAALCDAAAAGQRVSRLHLVNGSVELELSAGLPSVAEA